MWEKVIFLAMPVLSFQSSCTLYHRLEQWRLSSGPWSRKSRLSSSSLQGAPVYSLYLKTFICFHSRLLVFTANSYLTAEKKYLCFGNIMKTPCANFYIFWRNFFFGSNLFFVKHINTQCIGSKKFNLGILNWIYFYVDNFN